MNEIDLVISSDLKRAIMSAENIFKGEKDIFHDERIRECNYGDLNGKDNSLVKYEEHINEKEAINNDWRKSKAWQPGWIYEIKSI